MADTETIICSECGHLKADISFPPDTTGYQAYLDPNTGVHGPGEFWMCDGDCGMPMIWSTYFYDAKPNEVIESKPCNRCGVRSKVVLRWQKL